MNILVTGSLGYIGKTVCALAVKRGHKVVGVDWNGRGIDTSTGVYHYCLPAGRISSHIFERESIDTVIHLAAHISSPESVWAPMKYYENNLAETIRLVNSLRSTRANLIFASSAAVVHQLSPYGKSKAMAETVIRDGLVSHTILRYYNVSGKGTTGDPEYPSYPSDNATNLIYDLYNSKDQLEPFRVFGKPSCIRDYVHVNDVAGITIDCAEHFQRGVTFNVGTGIGTSVEEVISRYAQNGVEINWEYAPSREGDPDVLVADRHYDWNYLPVNEIVKDFVG